ncbi:GDSL esterase/lipase At3g27950-like [Rhodamnia argentea]|uniref:GDSL esterase/lipase At3g27950-like n=1 Tax=Rhodamnia argentea TaxID=178133 RepID=A0ABM3HSU0_9MYRT|nr:GDSL esterase/lipase At3g27950-like [Rhodamnia argentea]
MALVRMLSILVLLVLGLAMTQRYLVSGSSPSCNFSAIYNFGDSNSDTGGRSAAFTQIPPPYGETNLGNPPKRLSNGHVILDFIICAAERLGLPYMSAYLDSIGTNFRCGANFATGDSSILPGPFSPFDLGIQISQFKQFKSRTTELYKNLSDSGEPLYPSTFCSSLARIMAHQASNMHVPINPIKSPHNHICFSLCTNLNNFNMTVDQIVAAIPGILDGFEAAIQQLYGEGARAFWIHNTGPIGCLPFMALPFKFRNGTLDQNGCIAYQNNVVQEFNQQLKERVDQLKNNLSTAAFTYVDVYSAKLSLISDAKNQGNLPHIKGYYFSQATLNEKIYETTAVVQVNGTTIHGDACGDPQDRISWDGIHFTDAANSWIASRILNGSMSDPPVPVANACP